MKEENSEEQADILKSQGPAREEEGSDGENQAVPEENSGDPRRILSELEKESLGSPPDPVEDQEPLEKSSADGPSLEADKLVTDAMRRLDDVIEKFRNQSAPKTESE